jgi:hypothetical protein
MRWIDTTHLKIWAPRRDCQGHLSLVIRRLIRATAENISQILFPAGDSIAYPGWDGLLESASDSEYIPKNFSVWEIGTNQNIKEKAEEDYQKRKENPLGAIPAETIFIFVTPRIWAGKNEWRLEKQKEGIWKDVLVYDAETLEEWLEQAPAVGAWLARYLGIYPNGVISLEDYWSEWTLVTNPPLSSDIMMAGREN